MAQTSDPVPARHHAVRLDATLEDRIDRLKAALHEHARATFGASMTMTKSDAMRAILEAGCAALEARFGLSKPSAEQAPTKKRGRPRKRA